MSETSYHPRRMAPATTEPLPPAPAVTAPAMGVVSAVGPASVRLEQPAPPRAPIPPAPRLQPALTVSRASVFGEFKAEWIKLWSLPSTWWVLAATVVGTTLIGMGIAVSLQMVTSTPGMVPSGTIPAGTVFRATDAASAMQFGQMIISILAVMFIANEYASGQIRSTLTAVPGRLSMLVAKAGVIGVVTFVVTWLAAFGAILAGWPFLRSFVVDDRFTLDAVRMVAGMGLATTLVALFALGVGFVVRNAAAGIGIVLALLFVVQFVAVGMSGWPWVATAHAYLLDSCQTGLYQTGGFGFVKSLWVTGLWALVPLALAGILLKTRDA